MIVTGLATFVVAFSMLQATSQVSTAPANHPATNQQASPDPTQTGAVPQSATTRPDCNGVPCEEQRPNFVVSIPPPAPQPWLLRERISWGAYLLLALLGYVGIMVALSTLKKIERNTAAAQDTAQAALETAQAALLNAQSIVQAERPWLLISVEPALDKPNSFTITARNRGRTPASIVKTFEQTGIKTDEAHLPETPEYKDAEGTTPLVPIILVPGESTSIKVFSRDDVRGLCDSEDKFKRIEDWDEKVFLHGKIIYRDLIAPYGQQVHETNWCCWYIHGRQKSGMVIAGPPAYNAHT